MKKGRFSSMKAISFEDLKNTIITYVENVGSARYVHLTKVIAERLAIGPATVESAVKHLVDFGKLEGESGESGFGWKYIRLPREKD